MKTENNPIRLPLETWGLFLESPETFRAYFGCHNSLCIFKTKASRGTKLCSYFDFLFPLQRIKRPALQNKQVVVLRTAFRARKVFGTFEKRAPGPVTKNFDTFGYFRWFPTNSLCRSFFLKVEMSPLTKTFDSHVTPQDAVKKSLMLSKLRENHFVQGIDLRLMLMAYKVHPLGPASLILRVFQRRIPMFHNHHLKVNITQNRCFLLF